MDENVLHKRTALSRQKVIEHLRKLYAGDLVILLFRVLKGLWDVEPEA